MWKIRCKLINFLLCANNDNWFTKYLRFLHITTKLSGEQPPQASCESTAANCYALFFCKLLYILNAESILWVRFGFKIFNLFRIIFSSLILVLTK